MVNLRIRKPSLRGDGSLQITWEFLALSIARCLVNRPLSWGGTPQVSPRSGICPHASIIRMDGTPCRYQPLDLAAPALVKFVIDNPRVIACPNPLAFPASAMASKQTCEQAAGRQDIFGVAITGILAAVIVRYAYVRERGWLG
jgi:hypothetical protein